jgi:DNA-binding CsgD family transcriptional regulator
MSEPAPEIVGREHELDILAEAVDAAAEGGCSLAVCGEPGIGKSALIEAAARRGQQRGYLVLRATGVEAESQLPFAGLHELIRPVLGAAGALAPPQRRALLSAFGLDDDGPPEPFLICLAALNLLTGVSARQPVAVIVDDLHWLDQPSQDAVAFLGRRIHDDPVIVMTGIRTGYDTPYLPACGQVLDIGPLDAESSRTLLRACAPDLDAAGREQILDYTRGNPLALAELPATWRRRPAMAGLVPGSPVRLSTRLEQAFAGRLGELGSQSRDALLIAAADSQPALAEILAASELAGVQVPVDVLDEAAATGIVTRDEAGLQFRHPLVRSAILGSESAGRRQRAHAALAAVLAGQPYRQAWHRAQAVIGPDDEVADEWHSAALALDAMAHGLQGDNGLAQELAAEAEQLAGGSGLNPPLACVQLARGYGHLSAGNYAAAYQALRRLFDPADPSYHQTERFHGVSFLSDAAGPAGHRDDALRIVGDLELVAAGSVSTTLRHHLPYARAVLADEEDAGDLYLTALGSDLQCWPWLRGRLQLAFGRWLRRRQHVADARESLRSAHDTLAGIGARFWADQAETELRAAGEQTARRSAPGWETLTAQELQIVRMAAEGFSNKQIGQRLYLSPRTVSGHLYRAFPKLGITSRGQIAACLHRRQSLNASSTARVSS